jgi:hypothetical protein
MKIITAALVALTLSGCAILTPPPCPSARKAMEAKGYEVLECWDDQEADTYERVQRCYARRPGTKFWYVKTVFSRHCGL